MERTELLSSETDLKIRFLRAPKGQTSFPNGA